MITLTKALSQSFAPADLPAAVRAASRAEKPAMQAFEKL